MTAAARRRPQLGVLSDTAAATLAPGEDSGWLAVEDTDEQHWQAQTVIDQWSAEHQLVGALMWLTAKQARPILELVPDAVVWRPVTQWTYEIIRTLVAGGRDPHPVSVLSTARQQSWSRASQCGPAPTRHHRQLAVYLAAAYNDVLSPAAAAGDYARQVLDEAYRRAFRDNGIRMRQLGECGAERDDLTEQFAAIRADLADLWRRCEAAAKPGWWRP